MPQELLNPTREWKIGSGGSLLTVDISQNLTVSGTNIKTALDLKADLASPIFTGTAIAEYMNVAENLTVGGNLVVDGSLTYLNITQTLIQDPVIVLGSGPSGEDLTVSDFNDRGIRFEYFEGSNKSGFMGYDTSESKFKFVTDATFNPNTLASNDLSSGTVGEIVANLDGIIGANTPAAGTFTTVTASNALIIGTANIDGTDLLKLDNIADGTVTSSKAVVVNTTRDISGFNNITATGTITAANIVGNVTGSSTSKIVFKGMSDLSGGKLVKVNTLQDMSDSYFVNITPSSDSSSIKIHLQFKVNYTCCSAFGQTIDFYIYKQKTGGSEELILHDKELGTGNAAGPLNGIYYSSYIDTPKTDLSIKYWLKFKLNGANYDYDSGIRSGSDVYNSIFVQQIISE